jgi:mRNA turnover protein 4
MNGNIIVLLLSQAGPIMQHHSDPPEVFPHSMEAQLRKLGLSSRLERGVPTLDVPHTLCKEGDILTSEQVRLHIYSW